MKIIYSKDINLLNSEKNSILYPELNKTFKEIIDFINDNINDNSVVITLSETVIKQIGKLVKKGILDKNKLIFESNLEQYKEYDFSCDVFLETYSNQCKYAFSNLNHN